MTGFCRVALAAAMAIVLACGPRNHAPEVPTTPIGPAYGLPDSTYAFSTSTSDPDGDSVALEFSWGSSTATERTGLMAGGEQVVRYNHWRIPRVYKIRVRAIDKKGRASDWTPEVEIEIVHPDSLPLTPLRPEGPDSVRVGFIEEYRFPTRGPAGESLLVAFNWGDGRISERWEASICAGETVKTSQVYWRDGDWYPRSMVQDSRRQTLSDWSLGCKVKARDFSGTGWRQIYDDAYVLFSVAPTHDGGLIATGESWGERLLLVKLDDRGNVVWRREYDSLYFCGVSVRETEDRGLVVVGALAGWYPGPWGADMARLDESGELLWSRHFDQFWSGCAVRQAPDGGFVIATGDALLKTDQNGDSLWAVGLVAEDVEVTPDRSYVVAGRFRGESTLCKLDSTGSILWSRHLGTRPLGATAVAILPGGFVVAGDSIESVVLWKFDRNGELAWRRLQRAAADLCITNVAVAPSGDLFVGGEAAYAGYFARADAQGSLKWQRLLCQYGFSTEILPLADRGCLVAGGDFGCWESGVIWKVDENGGIGPAGPDAGFPDGDGARGGARTAWRARAERLRSAMRGERRVK